MNNLISRTLGEEVKDIELCKEERNFYLNQVL